MLPLLPSLRQCLFPRGAPQVRQPLLGTMTKKMISQLMVSGRAPQSTPQMWTAPPTERPESPRICGEKSGARSRWSVPFLAVRARSAGSKPLSCTSRREGESWLTSAIPMDNPHCSCKLTHVWSRQPGRYRRRSRPRATKKTDPVELPAPVFRCFGGGMMNHHSKERRALRWW